MEKLNICLVSTAITPDSQDGASKFFRGIFEYLRKKGHNVKLVTGKWNFDLNNSDIYQIDFIQRRFFWFPQFFLKTIKYLNSNDFDIIHGNGPKASLPIIFSNKDKFISTIHDLGPFETKFTVLPIEKYLIKYVVHKASYLTSCSDIIKNQINYYIQKVEPTRIINLYSAIEPMFKPYPNEAQKLRESIGIKGPILLYIGRIARYKGVEDIINAYKIVKRNIPNLNLIMGGTPDFSMTKIYQEWKSRYKDIHFIGFVPIDKMPIYYTMADIFITYSYASEGFGLTPIEAIACGTPVICSSMPAYREILQNNAIFVPPKSPHLLAQEIIKILSNEQERKILIENAMQFIKRYSWNSVGKKLEQLYYKFLKLN